MRKIKTRANYGGISYDKLAASLNKKLATRGSFSNENAARLAYSLESLSEDAMNDSEAVTEDIVQSLTEEVGEEEWNEELTEAQRDAGVIVAHATADPITYHAAATAPVEDGNSLLDASSVEVSTESYDARELEKHMHLSIAFNVGAARQDKAMEAVWPTITLTADQAGLNLEVTRNMVHYEFKHTTQGAASVSQFDQRSLIDALIDTRILHNHATDIVPLYNTTSGVFDQEVGPKEVVVDNQKITTGSVLFNTPFNLISMGANSLTDPFSVMDQTDTIDHLVRLKSVFVEIQSAAGQKSLVELDTLDLLGTQFQRSSEGHERDMGLSWNSDSYPIDGTLKDKTGVPATALADFRTGPNQKYVLHLRISANGRLNLADGNGELQSGSVAINRIYETVERTPGYVDLELVEDPAEIARIKGLITSIKLKSFTLDARYANVNRRERGLIVRTDRRNVKYAIPLQPPITAMKPVTETASGYNVDAAVQSARVKNSTDGVLELLRMDALLARYRSSSNRLTPSSDIPGIGTFLIRPYYENIKVDMTDLVNNQNSHTLEEDIASHLTLLIKDRFAKAIMISGWSAAAECNSNNKDEKPTAVIVTDQRTAQHLWVKGDTRLLGNTFNALPVVSSYTEFRNRIYVVPRRESSTNAPDGLNWGNMFWLPELIVNMPIARNGQISQEFAVQTRRRHICHCPIMLRIDILNLDKVVDTKVATAVTM